MDNNVVGAITVPSYAISEIGDGRYRLDIEHVDIVQIFVDGKPSPIIPGTTKFELNITNNNNIVSNIVSKLITVQKVHLYRVEQAKNENSDVHDTVSLSMEFTYENTLEVHDTVGVQIGHIVKNGKTLGVEFYFAASDKNDAANVVRTKYPVIQHLGVYYKYSKVCPISVKVTTEEISKNIIVSVIALYSARELANKEEEAELMRAFSTILGAM